jgi:uncharacterized OB-fold protein/acyl dehydratase
MSTTLAERLQGFVGRPTGPARRARDPVNQPMIRHWCDAVGDANPVYTDPAAAAGSAHGGIVAPPAMLQAWTMRGLERSPGPPGDYAIGELFALLDEAGFTSVVATDSDQEYARPLRLGDHLTVSGVVEAVSDEKRTALGAGHFVTWVDTYRTDGGEAVGTMRFRVLKFRPAAASAQERRPRPAVSDDTRFFWEGVERGELLIQRCAACGELRHPPRPMCPRCRSLDWDAVRAGGRGTVHSYVVPHHPRLPAFPDRYVVALVDLEEGTRLVTNLIEIAPEEVSIGMAVELVCTKVDDELVLPLFRPA